MIELYIFILGAIIGSFLNVCIFRIPESVSLIRPGSTCAFCRSSIRFYDNIPIFSFLILLGRCRRCGKKLSIIYPIVEILTGIMSLSLYLRYGVTVTSVAFFVLISALIVVSFIDLKHYIIPDSISLSGIFLGFFVSFIPGSFISPLESFLSILAGGGGLLLIAIVYEKITSREGIGGGDIKLLAMLGAFLGFKYVVLILFLSSIIGSIIGTLVILLNRTKTRHSIVPFGPFLSIGAVIAIFYGEEIISYYLELFYV